MDEHAVCAARLRNGERCRSVAASNSPFCGPHRDLVATHGEEVVRNGSYLRQRQSSAFIRVVSEEKAPAKAAAAGVTTTPVRSSNGRPVAPQDVRPRLAELAA